MSTKLAFSPGLKIVSGGQTGVDQAALDWAISHGIAHGGWCPKGRRSERGRIDARYQLTETPSSDYVQRTEWNVRDSDATWVFTPSERLTGGSRRTADYAEKRKKLWLHVHPGVDPDRAAKFIADHRVRILNVAGKRESGAPGIALFVGEFLDQALLVETAG